MTVAEAPPCSARPWRVGDCSVSYTRGRSAGFTLITLLKPSSSPHPCGGATFPGMSSPEPFGKSQSMGLVNGVWAGHHGQLCLGEGRSWKELPRGRIPEPGCRRSQGDEPTCQPRQPKAAPFVMKGQCGRSHRVGSVPTQHLRSSPSVLIPREEAGVARSYASAWQRGSPKQGCDSSEPHDLPGPHLLPRKAWQRPHHPWVS